MRLTHPTRQPNRAHATLTLLSAPASSMSSCRVSSRRFPVGTLRRNMESPRLTKSNRGVLDEAFIFLDKLQARNSVRCDSRYRSSESFLSIENRQHTYFITVLVGDQHELSVRRECKITRRVPPAGGNRKASETTLSIDIKRCNAVVSTVGYIKPFCIGRNMNIGDNIF